MNLSSLIKKNFSFIAISAISRLIVNSLLFIIVGRFYGTEIFGSFTSSYTLSLLFTYLADYGFDVFITAEVAKNRNDIQSIVSRFFLIKIIFTSIAVTLFFITCLIIPSNTTTKIILMIFSLNIIFSTLLGMIFSIFKGFERFNFEAKISIVTNITLLVVIVFLSYFRMNIYYIVFAIIIFRLFGLILAYHKLESYVSVKDLKFDFKISKIMKDIKHVSAFGLDLLFGSLFLQIDTILILSIKGEAQAGIYQSVFRIAMIIFIFPDLIINTLFPTIIRLYHQKNAVWEKLSEISFRFLYFISLPVALFLFIYSEETLRFIYGQKDFFRESQNLQDSISILKIATFIFILRFCATPFAMVITIKGEQYKRTIVVIIATILNILLNIYFIPQYGAMAAIVVSVFTNLFALTSYIYFSNCWKWLINYKIIFLLLISLSLVISFHYLNHFVSIITQIIFIPIYIIFGLKNVFSSSERKLIFE